MLVDSGLRRNDGFTYRGDDMIPGEILTPDGEIVLNDGVETLRLRGANA